MTSFKFSLGSVHRVSPCWSCLAGGSPLSAAPTANTTNKVLRVSVSTATPFLAVCSPHVDHLMGHKAFGSLLISACLRRPSVPLCVFRRMADLFSPSSPAAHGSDSVSQLCRVCLNDAFSFRTSACERFSCCLPRRFRKIQVQGSIVPRLEAKVLVGCSKLFPRIFLV